MMVSLLGVPAGAWAGVCPGDADGDLRVGQADLGLVLAAFGSGAGEPGYHPRADFDRSGRVDQADLGVLLANWDVVCPCQVHELELACRTLVAYPHVRFVRAFHVGTPVWVAIDPYDLSTPDRTADVYIVADKTRLQWTGDPSLVDVRGQPQTLAFAGATIQANTFQLAGSEQLSAEAGLGVGRGYDLVCDFNRNGVLDGCDYIDGLGDDAGFYVVHDTTLRGPLAVTELNYNVAPGSVTPGFEPENTFYPTDIAAMGRLPLVVVSHGNGHDLNWYDHIGFHLASYGYIVMSHRNNTQPGTDTAAVTTLEHTDAFIEQLGTIGGGVMQGHVDTHRIIWIGHSRGGEGVVRAYDRIVRGTWTPRQYGAGDLLLVCAICPTYFTPGIADANIRDKTFHMFYTGADADVTGSPGATTLKPLALYERGTGRKTHHYFHGAGHGDFHNGSGAPWATGPDLIGRPATHKGLLGYLLPMVKHYAEGNRVGLDFLQRLHDEYAPIGVPANVIIAKEYKDHPAAGNFVIDNFESRPELDVSSSGGAVRFDVSNVAEGRMVDLDGSFDWNPTVPFNGHTRARYDWDQNACVVFDWPAGSTRYYELEIVPAQRDLRDDAYLSFRACQGTRHPETDALNARLSFTVTLRDAYGVTSSIDFRPYAGTITRTYLRTGSGTGAGWANEYSTVRIRLKDFTHDSPIFLGNIVAVRFEFGAPFGSPRGRISLDDIEITRD